VVALILGIGLLLWMLSVVLARLATFVSVAVIAVLFSYLIYPLVKLLARRMPRAAAVLVVYAGFLLVTILVGAYLVPPIATQANELARSYPALLDQIQREFADPKNSVILRELPPQIRAILAENAGRIGQEIGKYSAQIAGQTIAILTATIHAVFAAFLVLVFSFFFITDFERIQDAFFRLVPRAYREAVIAIALECDQVIGGFIRGQVIVAAVVGVLATIIMLATHVKYALLLGLIAGVADVIPYVGAIVSAVPAVLISLVTYGWPHALLVLVLFVLMHELEGHFITPAVVGHSVGLTPLTVLAALLIGGEALGLIGLLLAVPVAGIVRVFLVRLFPPSADGERALVEARVATVPARPTPPSNPPTE